MQPQPQPQHQQAQRPPSPRLRQPPPGPKRGHTRHVLSYWRLEILTVLVAILLLVAIVGLLAYYDGHYMPEWPFQINLNSAIAFLTTFLRAAIVAAVAEIIGQIKWTWFTERTRPLHHLQDFDAASRSVLGSLRLLAVVLWNWGFTSAGFLGMAAALVTIASLAVSPVTQQALRTGVCPQIMHNARSALPVANYVPGTSSYYRVGAGQYELEVDMKSAMIQGLTDPRSKDSNVDVTCSTGNCTWPDHGTGVTHATIGLCSACLDTTDYVSAPNAGGNLTLPDEGAYINFGGDYMWVGYSNLTAYAPMFDENFARAASVSVSNVSMLLATTSPCTKDAVTGKMTCPHKISQSNNTYYDGLGDYIAASCILYPCMKEYAAHYENNVLTEKLVRTTTAVPNTGETTEAYTVFYNYTAGQSPCVLDNGTWYDYSNQSTAEHVPGRTWANISLSGQLRGPRNISVPNACLYKMDGIFFYAVSNFLTNSLLKGSCFFDIMQSGHINCGDAWWLTPLWIDMNATYATLTTAMDDFAWAVTNKFRMTGLGPDQHAGFTGAVLERGHAYGAVWEGSTCTYFDRRWIALPVILVLLCAFLLACIAIKNYRDPEQPVWKGSVLPLIFFGLHAAGETSSSGAHARALSASTAAAAAAGRPGRLGGDGDGDLRNKGRHERTATFFKENGRAAPELDRIQDEAGRMWVRFHGGTDPGFVDLGTMGRRNNDRRGDAEASVESLVPDHAGDKKDSLWSGFKMKRSKTSLRRGSSF